MTYQRKNNSCDHVERLVDFLYGEMAETEKADFQRHALHCSGCAEELSELAFVRSSINEWREKEFAPLATPAFAFPVQTQSTVTGDESGFRKILAVLNFKSLRFAAATAMLTLLFAGLGWILLNFSARQDIADNRASTITNVQQLNTAPAIVNDNLVADKNTVSEKQENEKNVSAAEINEKAVNSGQHIPIKAVAAEKSIERQKKQTVKYALENRTAEIRKPASKSVKNQKLPSLYTEDAEVESIRLSDILEEVSMR